MRLSDTILIDLLTMPIVKVARDSHIEAVVAMRRSETVVVVEVYRYDPKDVPKPINVDRYCVWETLPVHLDYKSMVNLASTEDNSNMRGFLNDHVFLVKDIVTDGHRLAELPAMVRNLLRGSREEAT
jgi:hypothetical protein